jgi:hypothetical protein
MVEFVCVLRCIIFLQIRPPASVLHPPEATSCHLAIALPRSFFVAEFLLFRLPSYVRPRAQHQLAW